MVEGTPLLRAHLGKTWIQGSNPCVSAKKYLAKKTLSFRVFFRPKTVCSEKSALVSRQVNDLQGLCHIVIDERWQ